MQGQKMLLPIHLHGTLAANATFRWKVPSQMHVDHVSVVASNDSDATFKLGISTDDDSILAAAVIGDSGTPVEKTRADFASTNPTGKLNDGDILLGTLDFDGSAGTPAADVTIVITLLDG